MPNVNRLVGDDGNNTIQGTAGADLIYGFNPAGPQGQASSIAATRVATGLDSPLFATAPTGDATRLFIVERAGEIKILDLKTGQVQSTPFLDVSDEIVTTGEQGLLGLTFHPDFDANGLFYIHLTNTSGDVEIRSYRASATNPDQADPASRQLVLLVDEPEGFATHRAGWLDFGPDNYLYVALGDGGGIGDPLNNAQNFNNLLGSILRLNVNSDGFPQDAARNYAIPADNPFVGRDGADEIWAFGLRNPWRDSFDRGLDDLFIADVGQDSWEEINLGVPGANYGWRIFEGPVRFESGTPTGGVATPPIAAYDHNAGESITGGYVYRGESDGLHGDYFFADFIRGRVWTLDSDGAQRVMVERTSQITTDAGTINRP